MLYGTAWASSDDDGLKRVNVAVGIGLGGNGGREIAAVKKENSELKARIDQQQQELAAQKRESAAQQKELIAIKKKTWTLIKHAGSKIVAQIASF